MYVGLSGGVDSSVSAALLKEQGYKVVGVYMKNWSRDLPGMPCPWKDDYLDAKRVAVQLGIDFKLYDFEKDYKLKVVDYMLAEYRAGRTPNPDVMCNQEIKFKLFLDTALEQGADYVATGHYARLKKGKLLKAADPLKDQTYFLYRLPSKALQKILFPLGDLKKSQVRELAGKYRLITAKKPESMGICFVGKVGIKDFLLQYVAPKAGNIIDQKGKIVGKHDGAIFYTIGQRHGLNIGGGLPYYVSGKNMTTNEVQVTTNLQDQKLWSNKVSFTHPHWLDTEPRSASGLAVRVRHQGPLIPLKKLRAYGKAKWRADAQEAIRALAPGQSVVVYRGQQCLGGGIVV